MKRTILLLGVLSAGLMGASECGGGDDDDSYSEVHEDCEGASADLLAGSCVSSDGKLCFEWSTDIESSLEDAQAAWQASCANGQGTWSADHCDTVGSIGVCTDTATAGVKAITVYFPSEGLTPEMIQENFCSSDCQTFSLPR